VQAMIVLTIFNTIVCTGVVLWVIGAVLFKN
jgi:hypothetical protein